MIGSDYWGSNLIRKVAQIPTAVLHTVCDLNEIAGEYHPLHVTTQMDDILHDPEIDGVILATPTITHADFARRVLNADKHVLVEKPLQPATPHYGWKKSYFPNCEAAESIISLPIYPELTSDLIEKVVDALVDTLRGR